MAQIETFELGAQISGKDADAVVYPQMRLIKQRLSALAGRTYAIGIAQFSFILRVDGSVRSWGFEGTDAVKLDRKGKYVTADIGVPKSWWQNRPEAEVRSKILFGLREALKDMVKCLEADGIAVERQRLFSDFDGAIRDP